MATSIILHQPSDCTGYENGTPIIIVTDNIENVQESFNEDIEASSIIISRDGKKYFVKETIEEINALINS